MRYEYKVEFYYKSEAEKNNKPYENYIEIKLNDLSKNGWELFSNESNKYIFRRPVGD